ncbi:hypothetical protein CFC21_091672 [Triticum aestivum]|uniref:Leucine-rich repeat-containing N-terminal plant-type domain-containing protein n=2 Tax=Triticum aestivum TaxID=4565 RepID=A0A3B6QDY4_WHEAT|nr:hypothetical protein CFC21_091672 [Triticum aestivum]
MHPPPKLLLLLLLLAVLLAASPHALAEPPPAAATCTPQERDALLAFKQGITISSDAAGLLASWREDDCCRWRGVRCSNRTGHVVALNLRGQGLAGEISPSLLSLPHLEHLDLSSNRLVGPAGSIPEFLASGFSGKPEISRPIRSAVFWGSAVFWPSSIPHHLSNLTMITTPYVHVPGAVVASFQSIVGDMPVVIKRQELEYKGVAILEILSIDFSCNYLTGKIPEEITSLGGLINLNLSWNQLNGGLPKKIGDMQMLESLDFSNNDISGEIPSSLSNLTYLSILDLSYNHLAGIIPSGVQLDTLYTEYPSIYNGNTGLYGPILHKSCSVNNNAPQRDHQQRSKKVSESTLFFYFGLGSGFVAGLWVVFCALLFKKAWRVAYFRFFDKVHDKAYVFIIVTWGRFARKR